MGIRVTAAGRSPVNPYSVWFWDFELQRAVQILACSDGIADSFSLYCWFCQTLLAKCDSNELMLEGCYDNVTKFLMVEVSALELNSVRSEELRLGRSNFFWHFVVVFSCIT